MRLYVLTKSKVQTTTRIHTRIDRCLLRTSMRPYLTFTYANVSPNKKLLSIPVRIEFITWSTADGDLLEGCNCCKKMDNKTVSASLKAPHIFDGFEIGRC